MVALILGVLTLPADTVTGRIVDTAGHAVPQAIVEVAELGTSVTTSAEGAFRLNIAPGRYTLAVRRHGYAPVVREVVVTPGTPTELQIMLTPSAFQLEPLTVTATRQPLPSQSSPLPATALMGDELRNAQSVSLAHVVEALPGVRAISTGAQIGKPVIRGFAGPRVLVLENGSRLEDYSWSDEDGPSVETAFVRRIELIRGPASVLYGSDAVGGVINVIPDQLPDASGGAGFTRSGFMLSGATNNVEVAAAGQAEGAKGNFGWRVNAIGRGSGNLHTPDGELDNTGFGAFNGDATGGWRWASGGNLTFRVVHYGGEFKLLEANAPPGEAGGPERKAADNRFQITGQRPLGRGAWRLEGKGQLQAHSLIEVADDTTGTESEAFNLQLKTGSLDLLLHHGNTTFGIAGMGQTNDARGREPIVPDARTISGAAFALQRWSIADGRWAVLAGLRGDAQRLHADRDDSLGVAAQERNAQAWSGNVGVVFMPASTVSLTLNVGRAWRAPTLFELFANGPHIGEARYELGDSTLKPEVGGDVDLGLRWNVRRVRFEVSGYYNRLSDYIYITPTAAFIDSLRVYQYGQAEAEMLGGDAFVEAEIARGFVARGRFEAVRGTNLAAHEPLPLLPPRRLAVSLGWRDRLNVEVDNYATPTRLNPLDIPTDGYTLLNFGGGTALRLFARDMRLDIQLRNALDERYKNFLSRYKEFAYDPGRNLIVRLSSGLID